MKYIMGMLDGMMSSLEVGTGQSAHNLEAEDVHLDGMCYKIIFNKLEVLVNILCIKCMCQLL
jgi:hypothetical protein